MTTQDLWQLAVEQAAQCWPGVRISADSLRAHAERAGLAAPGQGDLGAELALVSGCLTGDPGSLRVFEEHYASRARTIIQRVRGDHAFIEDCLQDLRVKLLVGTSPKLATYRGAGKLAAWMRLVARNIAIEELRRREAKSVSLNDDEPDGGGAAQDGQARPEDAVAKARHGAAFTQALEAAMAELTARERNVLRMHVVHALSIDEIARPYGVHRATAARWIQATLAKLHATFRARIEAENQGITPSELDSLGRALRSDLRLTVSRLLASSRALT